MAHGAGWSFFGMHFIWWAVWVVLIVTMFKTVTPVPKRQLKAGARALDILRRRLAGGHVSIEEYERQKGVLSGQPNGGTPAAPHRH